MTDGTVLAGNVTSWVMPRTLCAGRRDPRFDQLLDQTLLPSAVCIEVLPDHPDDVRRQLNMAALQRAHVRPAEPTNKLTPFENDVLSGTPIAPLGAVVIGRKQDDGVADISITLELFNDRFPGIHLVS